MRLNRLADFVLDVRGQLRAAKGWWAQITQDTGVTAYAVRAFANSDDYRVTVHDFIQIAYWFEEYGDLTLSGKGPQGLSHEAVDFKKRQIPLLTVVRDLD